MEHVLVINILRDYNLGNLKEIEELSPGYANRGFRLQTDRGVFLFRWVLEKGIEDLHQEINLLNRLKSISFPTAYPISKIDGSYVTKLSKGYAVLYDFIEGNQPELGNSEVRNIGEAVGKLSLFKLSNDFNKKNSITIASCISLSNSLSEAPNQYPDIYNYFRIHSDFFSRRIELDLPMGLIHADIFPDNTLYDGNKLLGIIDFEEACRDELLFDLAMTINGFCFPMNTLSEDSLTTLIGSYVGERMLTNSEWDAIPIYVAWTAHGMLSWHLVRLSQQHSERQEMRIRELMSRVIFLIENEKALTNLISYLR